MLLGQYKEHPNKDGPAFIYPPKNYRPIPIPKPKDQDLSEEQWKQFDGDVREGVVLQCLQQIDNLEAWVNLSKGSYIPGLLNIKAVIGLVIFAAEQIVQSETESKDQEQATNELQRIVADGIDDNGDDDYSEHAIELKHFINGNDGFRTNDSGMQLQANVNGEANPEINIAKHPPAPHLSTQTDQRYSEETVLG
ncbi:MAG: hypothetical protein EZS28_004287 [Streblomastix strix]|uniref:Uncharacterized protein n=1 Tax=Streblomastix strix TaxID=222440 RepID=A0A5J4WYK0_9EUKA|nr:MAG: hypothetical protein EZS28_004287 [Streblomastix strix]